MAGYSFRSEGLQCSGQIVGKVGGHLLVEGLAQDSGSYFLNLKGEMRRFASRREAEDYGAELAQDAENVVTRHFKNMSTEQLKELFKVATESNSFYAQTIAEELKKRGALGKDSIAMDPLTAKGGKILKNMESEYGEKKGKSVFYASANKGKITGVHDEAEGEAPSGEEVGDCEEDLYDVT